MWILALLLCFGDSTADFRVPVAPAESLHVRVTGLGGGGRGGSPVVLIPGLFGSSFGFRNVIPGLTAAGYRVIVVEPLGIGSSARPEHGDYTLMAQADRIAAVLDTLGVHDAVVVAHSLGAAMAYRVAYRRPDLVSAIVSLEGGPAEAAATPSFRRAMKFVPWIKWFGGIGRIRDKIHSSLVAASGDTSWVTDSVVAAYTAGAAANLDGTLKAFVRMAAAREHERLAPHLHEIRCPVQLLVGTAPHEGGMAAAELAELRASLASLAIERVAGSGLYIHEEQPQAVVDAVRHLASITLSAAAARDTP